MLIFADLKGQHALIVIIYMFLSMAKGKQVLHELVKKISGLYLGDKVDSIAGVASVMNNKVASHELRVNVNDVEEMIKPILNIMAVQTASYIIFPESIMVSTLAGI